jgi:hypothetical protein
MQTSDSKDNKVSAMVLKVTLMVLQLQSHAYGVIE